VSAKPEFDLNAIHRYFAVECFNAAWDLIDNPRRTPEEDEQMLHLSLASLWHWTQRPDCTAANLSVAYWQVARIYALLGQAENARRYAERCLAVSQAEGIPPFCLAYAYEALARAAAVAADRVQMEAYLHEAHQVNARISDPETRQQLLADLDTVVLAG
jgi:hypothetical protein